MTITSKQLKEISKIKELKFNKLRSYSEHSSASAVIELDLSEVKGKIRALLLEFFKVKFNAKKGERVRTLSIFCHPTKNWLIIKYHVLHGFGYSWYDDLENSFTSYLIEKYNIKKSSKTYKNLSRGYFYF